MAKLKAKDLDKKSEYKKKCKEYAKFLEDDGDYDWSYILMLLRYKLQRTRKYIATGHTVNRDQDCDNIAKVEDLLDKVVNYDYLSPLFKEVQEKFGKYSVKDYIKIPKKELDLQKQALKEAFDIMLQEIWNWWD